MEHRDLEIEKYSITGLYYRYKKMSDDDIRKYLDKITLTRVDDKGIGTIKGYYPISQESFEKVYKNPRGQSLTFDAHATGDQPLLDLVPFKRIMFLVKSSSRFFLKPDVGEIFDQINHRDLWYDKIKAICLDEGYQTLDDTQGEHFLMTATLLTSKEIAEKEKRDLINELHQL